MTIKTTDTAVLARVVESLEEPASFLLDRFFPQVQTEDGSEEIHFDIEKRRPRLTPFVHPTVAGIVVEGEGYETKSFKPAYAKDKRRIRPNQALRRARGEQIGGNLSASQRLEMALGQELRDQMRCLVRREVAMASEALRLGQVTVTGEKYPTVVVDFQRHNDLTVTLTGANRWGQAGIKPLDTIEDWAASVQSHSGAAARTVVMDPKAWKLFRADPDVRELLDIRRGSQATMELGPQSRGQGEAKARFVGSIGDFDFWVYSDPYEDDDGNVLNMMPDFQVLLSADGGEDGLVGVRAYGNILDEELGVPADRFAVKSWLEKDPAVRWLLLQSAPLVVPFRPNATFGGIVDGGA